MSKHLRLLATSDLHGQLDGLYQHIVETRPDILAIAGDIQDHYDTSKQWFQDNFFSLARHIKIPVVFTPGNHDFFVEKWQWISKDAPKNVTMLLDSGCEIEGLRFWGTPRVPHINERWMFEEKYDGEFNEYFDMIPDGLDVLIAHSPPLIRHLKVDVSIQTNSPHFGSLKLTDVISRKEPKLVLCGHIHSGDHTPLPFGRSLIANVSRLDEDYKIAYDPSLFWRDNNDLRWNYFSATGEVM